MESYRLGRLRFLRPPPAFVELNPASKHVTISFELIVVVQDDYGITIDSVGQLALALSVVDSKTHRPLLNPTLSYSPTTIDTSITAFHPLKLTLRFTQPQTSTFKFLLSAQTIDVPPTVDLSDDAKGIHELVGEGTQIPGEGWDGERYIFMNVLSGDVRIRSGVAASGGSRGKENGGGKKEEGISAAKVQTAIRRTHLPIQSGEGVGSVIQTIETAGLNNSTGQRLWDAAIALSYYFSLHPHLLLLLSHPSDTSKDEESKTKRPRLENRSTKILELGGGLALVSLVASSLLSRSTRAVEVICTDVAVTVESTLAENLAANESIKVRAAVLDWGPMTSEKIRQVLNSKTEELGGLDVTILASDVLYHPESHPLLLDTMLSLFDFVRKKNGGKEGRCQALIAYKPRTEGDDGFFALARVAGLDVELVWSFGAIQVYRFGAVGLL